MSLNSDISGDTQNYKDTHRNKPENYFLDSNLKC